MDSEIGCLVALLVCCALAIPIWLLVETIQRRAQGRQLGEDVESIQGALSALRRHVAELNDRMRRLEQGGVQPLPEATTPPPIPEPVAPPWVAPIIQEPERQVASCASEEKAPQVPLPLPEPETISTTVEETPAAVPPVPKPVPQPPAPIRMPPPPPAVIRQPLPEPEPSKPFDWESLVGVKLFSWVAGVALLVAAIAFLRYGIDHGWLTAPVRMTIGIVVGTGLLVACETKRAQEYAITAQALTAGGIATLFSTFFAAHALWNLIPSDFATFLLMVLVTAVAVVLSIRRDSIFIALLGLLGAFLTPVMLSTGEDRPFGLFGYLALLNIGLAWVARRKRWPVLTALSMGFTALYQLGWVTKFLDETKLGIGVGIFLLFPILAFGAIYLGQARKEDENGESPVHPIFRYTASFSAIPPLLFALHFAATPAYGEHYVLMLGFLLLVAAGLAVIALVRGPEWLHLLGGASTLVILAAWLGNGYRHEAWPAVLPFLALFVALYLGAAWLPTRLDSFNPFEKEGRWAVYTAPLLLFAFPVLILLEPATASPGLLFGTLFALTALLAAYSIRFEEGFIHFTACFFVLAAEAVWSTKYLDPKHLLSGLMVYGGFGLFYLGVPLMAQRKGRVLRPQGSGAILAFASLALLFFLTTGPIVHVSLWALAILVGILNLGLLHEASCGHHPILSLLGMVLSWILLVVWWISAPLVSMLVPALVVMAAFAVLVVGGSLWLKARSSSETGAAMGNPGVFLGLAGHLFLLAVAAQPNLSLPPWPWLAVLLVLDLALGTAALYLKRGAILLGSAILTQVVLMAWVAMVPWQSMGLHLVVGPWSALVFAGLGYGIYELARYLRFEDRSFSVSAGIGLVLAQMLLCLLCCTPLGATRHGLFLFANLVLAFGILALSWRDRAHGWALGLAFSIGLVLLAWYFGSAPRFVLRTPVEHAAHFLQLAVPLYLLQLAFPLVMGTRARLERLPFMAAIVASAVFFLFARPALMTLGYGSCIGALPVIQAILLTPHLIRLLRMEPVGRRDLARLAMVAGAILAFVTVAIPLQLEKQWITLGWALLGLALAWLYGRVPHKGLLVWTAGLLATVFVRLVLNPSVFGYHARSAVPIFNWYLYTYFVTAVCFFGAAWLLKQLDDRFFEGFPRLSTLLPAGGTAILFLLLNIEIADFFSEGTELTFRLLHGSLAQDLSYTIGWALFSIGMLAAGLVARSRATRIAAISLLTLTVFKAFLHDLSHLEGLYRVGSFVGLAICLSAVAVVLQKFVLRRSGEAK